MFGLASAKATPDSAIARATRVLFRRPGSELATSLPLLALALQNAQMHPVKRTYIHITLFDIEFCTSIKLFCTNFHIFTPETLER